MNAANAARRLTMREELTARKPAILLAAWITLAGVYLLVFIADLRLSYERLAAPCTGPQCHYQAISPAEAAVLVRWGLPVQTYALYMLGFSALPVALSTALAVAMLIRLYPQGQGFLYSLMLIVIPVVAITNFDVVAAAFPGLAIGVQILAPGGMLLVMAFFLLFPRTRFEPGWAVVIPFLAAAIMGVSAFNVNWQAQRIVTPAHSFTLLLLVTLAVIIYRYARLFDPSERTKTKWVIPGIALFFAGVPVWSYTFEMANPQPGQASLLTTAGGWTLCMLLTMALPAAVFAAILRNRLWDIDVFINRSLVYGGLTLTVAATYLLLVAGFGVLFHTQVSFLAALLATALIALLILPARDRLQRGVNRLMYGERDEPYVVLARLGQRLETTAAPQVTLQSVVETIAAALKLPYTGIELADEVGQLGGASTGTAVTETVSLPLRYQNEAVGHLVVSPRRPGETFSAKELQLLAAMAAQVGAVAHAVRLTAALQRSANALQQSREQLVLTREEERRRIRRDLHDELGPKLASQTFAFDGVIDVLQTNPGEAERLLRGLKTQNQETVAEIRRLVYELRPPALDELGFIGALQAHVATLNGRGALAVRISARPDPLPPLSAAVEVAAYRIALEAITNVIRHAQARSCSVAVRVVKGGLQLQVEIHDDGVGLPPAMDPGVGMRSMRERAEELGGSLTVARLAQGTRVTAVLPLAH